MLHSPGDADDSDAKQESKYYMNQGDPQARYEDPDDVKQTEQAAWYISPVYLKGAPEGPEAKRSDFDQLEAEGNPDDGKHHGHSS